MKRLSDNAIDIINRLHTERLDYNSEYLSLIDALNRLAAYKDTGFEPEDINDFMERWKKAAELGRLVKQYNIDHLCELVEAEKDGRLVVLPCKVGDTVFAAETSPVIPLSVVCVGVYLEGAEGEDWEDLDNFGKTVFLTCEEAEAALEAQKGEKHETNSV